MPTRRVPLQGLVVLAGQLCAPSGPICPCVSGCAGRKVAGSDPCWGPYRIEEDPRQSKDPPSKGKEDSLNKGKIWSTEDAKADSVNQECQEDLGHKCRFSKCG